MTFLRWALLGALGAGCASATGVKLKDGPMLRLQETEVAENDEGLAVHAGGERYVFQPERIEHVRPRGSGLLIPGASFAAMGAIGFGATMVIMVPYESGAPADPYDEGPGCELCAFGLGVALPPLIIGTTLLIGGAVQRRRSVRQLDRLDRRWAARGKVSFGIVAVVLATVFGASAIPMLASDRLGYERTGRGLLIGMAPVGLLGIGYLWRGARVLRGHRSRDVSLGPEGLRFDLSL